MFPIKWLVEVDRLQRKAIQHTVNPTQLVPSDPLAIALSSQNVVSTRFLYHRYLPPISISNAKYQLVAFLRNDLKKIRRRRKKDGNLTPSIQTHSLSYQVILFLSFDISILNLSFSSDSHWKCVRNCCFQGFKRFLRWSVGVRGEREVVGPLQNIDWQRNTHLCFPTEYTVTLTAD